MFGSCGGKIYHEIIKHCRYLMQFSSGNKIFYPKFSDQKCINKISSVHISLFNKTIIMFKQEVITRYLLCFKMFIKVIIFCLLHVTK